MSSNESMTAGQTGGLKRSMTLRTGDGDVLDIRSLQIPDDVKEILEALDFNGDGEAGSDELLETVELLKIVKQQLTGTHSKEEVHQGIVYLEEMMTAQKENHARLDYRNMPERIKTVLAKWDEMGNGFIDEKDLLHAVDCVEKIGKQNRMLRIAIIGLVVVIGLLLGGMFGLSIAAAELSKEVKVEPTGVMLTPTGDVVKVANAEFQVGTDGTLAMRASTCPLNDRGCDRRLQAGTGSTLKTSAAQESDQLISTLPDETWNQLLSIFLNMGNNTLKLTITEWNRVAARTSACGSVVHLHTQHGKFTVDDTQVSVDKGLSEHIHAMGFGNLLMDRRLTGFGHRQLKESDNMIAGFFNSIEGSGYNCTSQPLSAPEDLMHGYLAEVGNKHLAEQRADVLSKIHFDDEGNPLPLPGVVLAPHGSELREAFKTWKDKVLVMGNGVEAYLSTYAAYPFLKELRVKKGSAELRMVVDGITGHRCEVTDQTIAGSISGSEDEDSNTRMEFVGIVEEGGLVLRHFRLHLAEYVAEQKRRRRLRRLQSNQSADSPGELPFDPEMMILAGLIPTHMDYFDVDSDPDGNFQAGDPYRVTSYSTVPTARNYEEQTFLSVTPHPEVLDLPGVFAAMGVQLLGHDCIFSGNETSDVAELMTGAHALQRARTRDKPASLDLPFMESSELARSFQRLVAVESALLEGQTVPEEDMDAVNLARTSAYWNKALALNVKTENEIFEDLAAPEVDNSSRRLRAKEPAVQADAGAHRAASLMSERRGPRSLAGRRLGDWEVEFATWYDSGTVQHDLTVDFDYMSISAQWALDYAARDLVMVKAEGKGCAVVYTPPEVKVCAGGTIELYTDPWALGGSVILEIEVSIKVFKIMIGLEIGGKLWFPRRSNSGSQAVTVGWSPHGNTKCVDAGASLTCASNAGDQGERTNSDFSWAGDRFDITTSGSQVCARRLDSSGGWGMNLQIECSGGSVPALAIENLWGKVYIEIGTKRVALYAEIKGVVEPGVDCEDWCSEYYRKWKLTMYVTGGWKFFKKRGFFTYPVGSIDIGRR